MSLKTFYISSYKELANIPTITVATYGLTKNNRYNRFDGFDGGTGSNICLKVISLPFSRNLSWLSCQLIRCLQKTLFLRCLQKTHFIINIILIQFTYEINLLCTSKRANNKHFMKTILTCRKSDIVTNFIHKKESCCYSKIKMQTVS